MESDSEEPKHNRPQQSGNNWGEKQAKPSMSSHLKGVTLHITITDFSTDL